KLSSSERQENQEKEAGAAANGACGEIEDSEKEAHNRSEDSEADDLLCPELVGQAGLDELLVGAVPEVAGEERTQALEDVTGEGADDAREEGLGQDLLELVPLVDLLVEAAQVLAGVVDRRRFEL